MTSTQITPTRRHSNYRKCVLDIETTSFQPWSGRIICIGLKDADSGEIRIFQDEHEETLIMQFLKYYNKKNYHEIIGYNIQYDIRYIFAKCLKYKIPANSLFLTKQTDLMMILKNVKQGYNFNQPGKLNDWTKTIFGKQKLYQNTEIPELYKQGRIKDIIEYNTQDLQLEYELWKRITFVLNNETYAKNNKPNIQQSINSREVPLHEP